MLIVIFVVLATGTLFRFGEALVGLTVLALGGVAAAVAVHRRNHPDERPALGGQEPESFRVGASTILLTVAVLAALVVLASATFDLSGQKADEVVTLVYYALLPIPAVSGFVVALINLALRRSRQSIAEASLGAMLVALVLLIVRAP